MMGSPDVSVLLPVYNDEKYVEEAIESILDQNSSSFEVVIVDDGSTDRTPHKLARYEDDPRVTIHTHDDNQGLPAALNTGLEVASAPFIMRQDANDVSLAERMGTEFSYLQRHPDVAAVTTGAYTISARGERESTYIPPTNPGELLDERNPFVHGSVMLRRAAVAAVGGYDEFFRYSQDYDLWIRLWRQGYQLASIREPLYELRRDNETVSVSKRRIAAKYSILASAPATLKDSLLQRAKAEGMDEIQEQFPPALHSEYECRMVRAHVDNHHRLSAIRSAIRAIRQVPMAPEGYLHLGLSLVPWVVSEWMLSNMEGR